MNQFKKNRIIKASLAVVIIFVFSSVACATDRFVRNGDGTVSDTKAGLMWGSHDNGYPINWHDAKLYCENLRLAGFMDWRMPSLSELASIYDPSGRNSNGYPTIDLITTTAQSCWSSETRGYSAGRFNFTYGKEYWLRKSYSGPTRILPVREIQ